MLGVTKTLILEKNTMKLPLSWIKEYIDITLPPIEIAKILTMVGLEVDSVETVTCGFNGVVVGEVIACEKHPDAEKLSLATVTDGIDTYQVVCGAPNCRKGLKTAFAKIGAVLPDEEEGKTFKIKRTKIRGAESFGMLCSNAELKLSDDHDGIIEFPATLKVGQDVSELYTDTVFEISLTPNLGHCASVLGVCRELHASTETPLKFPVSKVKLETKESIKNLAKVTIIDNEGCPRYACRVIKNVKIGPSPQWLQNRLLKCGTRPINNVVDITNYVLLEMGHPLHAFDYDTLSGHEIIVRKAKEREIFVTLDGKERTLHQDDVLICDGTKPVAIAGVMGGQNSEVSDQTKNILLESAYFSPTRIRRTSKRLGLISDASHRFERGADPNQLIEALDRAAMLMEELCGGDVASGIIDIKERDFPEKVCSCRVTRVNQILGTKLSIGAIENIFQRLGFKYKWDGENTFEVTVPTYRVDIFGEIDLIEEVARINGYENLPKKLTHFHSSKQPHSEVFVFEREIRTRLLSEGLQEFLTCDLIGPSILEIVHGSVVEEKGMIKVLNPVSIEQSILRTSLLPGLLQVVKYNYDHQNQNISGFEVGRIHFKDEDKYVEETVFGIVLAGNSSPHHWDEKPREYDFYDLKGIIENLLHEFGVVDATFKNNHLDVFHTGRQASVYVNSLEIGSIGEIHPSILRRLDVGERVLFAEFNLRDLFQVRKKFLKMKPIAIYPSSDRDWTITLDESVPIGDITKITKHIESPILEDVIVLDIYRSPKLGHGLKNVTLHFTYRDRSKTVSQESVDQEHARITDKVRSLMATGK